MARAIRLYAILTRMQPYGDGNKRTALLAANRLLHELDAGIALAPPLKDGRRHALSRWLIYGTVPFADPAAWDAL